MGDTISEEFASLPDYFQYVRPVIEVQKELGGSVKPAKVLDRVRDKIGHASKPSTQPAVPSRLSRIGSEMPKVRQVLIHAGLLDPSQKGIWALTEKGQETDIADIDLHHLNELRKKAEKAYREHRKQKCRGTPRLSETCANPKKAAGVHEGYRRELLELLKTLSTAGLEQVCREILVKSGFEKVAIIGQSGEDGFEGECIFHDNSLLRSYVMFQFKRVEGLIEAEEIRDFRNNMLRRADKGIFMTLCSFTANAKQEAQRDGVPPVILVDRHKLIAMIEKFKIPLKSA